MSERKKIIKKIKDLLSQKITDEHLEQLTTSFHKDEVFNRSVLAYVSIYLLFLMYYLLVTESILGFWVLLSSISGVILSSYLINSKYSLKIKGEKNKDLKTHLENYLISGKKISNEKFEYALSKLTLKEFQYTLNGLLLFSIYVLEFSLVFLIIGWAFKFLLLLEAFSFISITPVLDDPFMWQEIIINSILLLLILVRFFNLNNIRRVRCFLQEIIRKELKKVDTTLEELLDYKISEFKIENDELMEKIQLWSDLYLGSHFIGLRSLMFISDYRALIFNFEKETKYLNIFYDLKYKIEEKRVISKNNTNFRNTIKLIQSNIDRLENSLKRKLYNKDDRRAKIRTLQTWTTIIGIILSLLFSFLSFLNSPKS